MHTSIKEKNKLVFSDIFSKTHTTGDHLEEDQLAAESLAQWPWSNIWRKSQILLVFIEKK